jgi:CHASE2 domain-containing sensor protein
MRKSFVIAIVPLIPILFFSYFNTWDTVEYAWEDRLYQAEREVDATIVIIGIDQQSLDLLRTMAVAAKHPRPLD